MGWKTSWQTGKEKKCRPNSFALNILSPDEIEKQSVIIHHYSWSNNQMDKTSLPVKINHKFLTKECYFFSWATEYRSSITLNDRWLSSFIANCHNFSVKMALIWQILTSIYSILRIKKPPYKKEFQTLEAYNSKTKLSCTKLTWIKHA